MHYYQYMIHIHRPFVSKHRLSAFPTHHLNARTVCIDSAVAIAKLVSKYKSCYTLRYINNEAICIIFSTAVILVFASVSNYGGHDETSLVAHLSTCCNALAELGEIYEHASRTLDILLRIKRQWQAKPLVSVAPKRSAPTQGSLVSKKGRHARLVST
jgi:L-lactate permease